MAKSILDQYTLNADLLREDMKSLTRNPLVEPEASERDEGPGEEKPILNELQQGFQDRAKVEAQRLEDTTDSEFWFCVCLRTREQKEELLEKLGLLDIGDKYLDGLEVAKKLGITLVSRNPELGYRTRGFKG